MVIVNYWGRLGNNLFQYAVGRLTSENNPEFGKLAAKGIPGFPGTYDIVGNSVGTEDITVEGMFHDYELFAPYKERISKWFQFKKFPSQSDDKLVIHIRIGDYATEEFRHLLLPMDFYHRVIEMDKPKSVCIVTDEPVHPILQQFDAEIVSEDTLHDFSFLASAKRLCIANSTFSWWAGWLGDAERIYFPQRAKDYSPEIDLFHKLYVHDESRYIRINV